MSSITPFPPISYNYPLENYSGSAGSKSSLYSESTSSADSALVPYSGPGGSASNLYSEFTSLENGIVVPYTGESIASSSVAPVDASDDLPIEEDGSSLKSEDPYLLIPTGVRKVSIPSSISISPGPQTQKDIEETLQLCDPSDQQKIILEVSKEALKSLQSDPILKYSIPIGVGLGFAIGALPTICLGTTYFITSIYKTRKKVYKQIKEKTAPILIQKLAQESQKLAAEGAIPTTIQQASKNFRKLQVELHPDKHYGDQSTLEKSQEITAAYDTFKTLSSHSYHLT